MTTPNKTKHQFKKDLDKLISADYVLVPCQLSDDMVALASASLQQSLDGIDKDSIDKHAIHALWASLINHCLPSHD